MPILSAPQPLPAHAVGIQISTSKPDSRINGNKPATKEIITAYPTAGVQIFGIYADNFTQVVTASLKTLL